MRPPTNQRNVGGSQTNVVVPRSEPVDLLRRPRPEGVRIGGGVLLPALDDRADDVHGVLLPGVATSLARRLSAHADEQGSRHSCCFFLRCRMIHPAVKPRAGQETGAGLLRTAARGAETVALLPASSVA